MVSDSAVQRVLNTPEAQTMRMKDKKYFGACGNVDRYNSLFSPQSIQNAVTKCRAKGGLNGDHIQYVLRQAGLTTYGSVPQLRRRIADNLGQCLRPFTPYYMYPRTDIDALHEFNEASNKLYDEQHDARERELVARWLNEMTELARPDD